MIYDPEIGDVLPDGFWEATIAEQDSYWDSRATYLLEHEQRRLAAIEISLNGIKRLRARFYQTVRDERERKKRQADCPHERTIRVSQHADEFNGVALDPEVSLSCRDCGVGLEVVA